MDKNAGNNNKYRIRSRDKVSKQKNNSKDKGTFKNPLREEEKKRRLKLISSMNKYRPGKAPTEHFKRYSKTELIDLKAPKGNSIFLEANNKKYLHDIFNGVLLSIFPVQLKHKFQFINDRPKHYFYNMTELDYKLMEQLEIAIRNHDPFKEEKLSMTLVYEKDLINPNKKEKEEKGELSLINNENNNPLQKADTESNKNQISTVLYEKSALMKQIDLENELAKNEGGILDINSMWEEVVDGDTNEISFFNPLLELTLPELPEGASLKSKSNVTNTNLLLAINNNINQASSTKGIHQTIINEFENKEELAEKEWFDNNTKEKIIWNQLHYKKLTTLMMRPARKQVTDIRNETAYTEGHYDYNIWYDKYLTDRKEEKSAVASLYKCNPQLDTGYTRADYQGNKGGQYFCTFFARGCCAEGSNCRFYHRVPTFEDCQKIDNLKDIFGRSRHSAHRTDMGGVGTFTRECRTLYITNIKNCGSNKDMVKIIYEQFSPWGKIEDINYFSTKASCFIRFSHRCFAEFAKEAMIGQCIVGNEIIFVKWALEEQDKTNQKRQNIEDKNKIFNAYKQNANKLNLLNKNNKQEYNNKNNNQMVSNQSNNSLNIKNYNSNNYKSKFSLINNLNNFSKNN